LRNRFLVKRKARLLSIFYGNSPVRPESRILAFAIAYFLSIISEEAKTRHQRRI